MLNVSLCSRHAMRAKPFSLDGSIFLLLGLDFTRLVVSRRIVVLDAIKGIVLNVEKVVGSRVFLSRFACR